MNTILKDRQWYIIFGVWIAINFFALMVSNCTWDKGKCYPNEFFPFCWSEFKPRERTVWKVLKRTYSYSEFFVYTLPAVVGFFIIRNRPMIDAELAMKSEEPPVREKEEENMHFIPVDKIIQEAKINAANIRDLHTEASSKATDEFRVVTGNLEILDSSVNAINSNEFRVISKTVGLSVYVIRYHSGVGMPELIGKTPLTLKLTPFIGNKIILSNGDIHGSVVVRNSQEYYFNL